MFLLLITSRIAIRLFSFNKILLFIKKLAFDGFYPLIVDLKTNRFLLCSKKTNRFLLCSKKQIDFCCVLKKLIDFCCFSKSNKNTCNLITFQVTKKCVHGDSNPGPLLTEPFSKVLGRQRYYPYTIDALLCHVS